MRARSLPRRGVAAAALGAVAFFFVFVPFGAVPSISTGAAAPAPTVGERFSYSVSFMGVNAGTLEVRLAGEEEIAGAACSVVEMEITSTNALLEALYPVRERWRSHVDRAGLFSRGYELSRSHRGKELADSQTFDYASGVSRWSRTEAGGVSSGTVELDGFVQDPVSWVFFVRRRIVAGAREVSFDLRERDRARRGVLKVVGEEGIDLGRPLGRVKALKASGGVGFGGLGRRSREDKVDQEASALWLDAATGILIKARIAAKVGAVDLVLVASENAPRIGEGQ